MVARLRRRGTGLGRIMAVERISLITALFLLCSALSSCIVWRGAGHEPTLPTASEATGQPTDASENTDATSDPISGMSSKNLGGAAVVVTCPDISYYSADGDGVFDGALTERTSAIQGKFNVALAFSEASADTVISDLRSAVQSGAFYSDLVALPMSYFGRAVRDGLVRPLEGVQSQAELSYRGSVYGVPAGGSTVTAYTYCVYFNASAAAGAGLDLYAEAAAGAWTWQRFYQLVSAMPNAGFTCDDDNEFVNCFTVSSGFSYTTVADGTVTLNAQTEAFVEALQLARGLISSGYAPSDDPRTLFYNGGCLFYIGTVKDAAAFADMPESYGVLPLPSYTAGGQSFSYTSSDMPVLCIPAGAAGSENSALMLQALCLASDGLDDAYVRELLAYSLRDNPSALNIMASAQRVKYDFAFAYGPFADDIANPTYWAAQAAVLEGKSYRMLYGAYAGNFNRYFE